MKVKAETARTIKIVMNGSCPTSSPHVVQPPVCDGDGVLTVQPEQAYTFFEIYFDLHSKTVLLENFLTDPPKVGYTFF